MENMQTPKIDSNPGPSRCANHLTTVPPPLFIFPLLLNQTCVHLYCTNHHNKLLMCEATQQWILIRHNSIRWKLWKATTHSWFFSKRAARLGPWRYASWPNRFTHIRVLEIPFSQRSVCSAWALVRAVTQLSLCESVKVAMNKWIKLRGFDCGLTVGYS